jgi:two-component system, cell cycle response regulator
MALRVLLADESTTIKKVMQLALQDFAVEVKAVHVGVDVAEVTRQFQPDIVFADVLLQKKNGYEVCAELKADQVLQQIPLVLMWSSFMDLDEGLASGCGADRRLEKPFDVENLRQLILELVPKTRSQRLAHFLKFPASFSESVKEEENRKREILAPSQEPQAQEPAQPAPPPPPVQTTAPPPAPVSPASVPAEPISNPSWNMDSFEDISKFEEPALVAATEEDKEDFSEFRIQPPHLEPRQEPKLETEPIPEEGPSLSLTEDDESWSHQDLSRFKLDLSPVSVSDDESGVEMQLSDPELERARILQNHGLGPAMQQPQAPPPYYGHYELPTEENLVDDSFESPQKGGDLTLKPQEIDSTPDELDLEFDSHADVPPPALARENLRNNPLTGYEEDFPASEAGKIPQLSSERLEEIIRAQSRDIIESVVRKLVPELASDIIREELHRLLEDTAVRFPDKENRR